MADYELPDNTYTNKDFQAVYEEMLEYARKLSLKWDPSQSNESDPGVVLIKELALFADKNNYNADKNLLEAFPSTVTQIGNARKLFEQLGYTMKWYRSGTSEISMKWIGDVDESLPEEIPIPKFTMVTDDKSNCVFTITDNKSLDVFTPTKFNVIEGVINDYTVAGEKIITASHLDADNRLYFKEYNVAENGIFICNVDDYDEPLLNYDEWNRVDNLLVEPYTYGDTYNRIYKFGVLSDGVTCYIEFPENASSIINYGINIKYILSNGENGNIKAGILSKFYNDVEVKDLNNSDVFLNQDNIMISNLSAIDNGYEPESIDDAYRNYKRTIGTFNTLVSLRDYMNSINTSGLVSNSFVTDRTNDPQSTYRIVTTDSGATKRDLYIEQVNGSPEIMPFDLKLYLLEMVDKDHITNVIDYENTFKVVENASFVEDGQENTRIGETVFNILNHIDSNKSIQHNFIPQKVDVPFMVINEYPVKCTIIPKHHLTTTQAEQIRNDVASALCDNLNSQKVDFGSSISYDTIYNSIIECNDLIKLVMLDDIVYTSYAVYYDMYKKDANGNPTPGYVYIQIDGDMSDVQYYGKRDGNSFTDPKNLPNDVPEGARCLNINDGKVYIRTSNGDWDFDNFDKRTTVQDDIYAKSVLNGNTQLFVKDEDFDYNYTQDTSVVGAEKAKVTSVSKIDTDVSITVNVTGGRGSYALKENENIILRAPNLIEKETYTIGVRFQYVINDSIPANADRTLLQNESICFYWKEEDSETAEYRYAYYGEGYTISPTFDMYTSGNAVENSNEYNVNSVPYIPSKIGLTFSGRDNYAIGYIPSGGNIRDNTSSTPKSYTYNEFIKDKLSGTANNLSSTKYVAIKAMNQKVLPGEDGLNRECYWILNKKTQLKSGEYVYELFPATSEQSQSYTLNSNEYFIYTNADHSEFEILGPGTSIKREFYDVATENNSHPSLYCNVLDSGYQSIVSNGIKSLSDYWCVLSSGQTLTLTENQIYTLGEGTELMLSAYNWAQECLWEMTDDSGDIIDYDNFIKTGRFTPVGDKSDITSSGLLYNYKFEEWDGNGDTDADYEEVGSYDLNHIYFDRTNGNFYIAVASSAGYANTFPRVTNSFAQLTVHYDGNKWSPYAVYCTSNASSMTYDENYNKQQFDTVLPPYSNIWKGCTILAYLNGTVWELHDSSSETPSQLFNRISTPQDKIVGVDISETELNKYIDLSNKYIDSTGKESVEPYGENDVSIMIADPVLVNKYLCNKYTPSNVSTSVYYVDGNVKIGTKYYPTPEDVKKALSGDQSAEVSGVVESDGVTIVSYHGEDYPSIEIDNVTYYIPKPVCIWGTKFDNQLGNTSITFYGDGYSIYSDNDAYNDLSNFHISYKDGNDIVRLPKIKVENTGWDACALLNIDMSKSDAQVLDENQIMRVTKAEVVDNDGTISLNVTGEELLTSTYMWKSPIASSSELLSHIIVKYDKTSANVLTDEEKACCILVDDGAIKFYDFNSDEDDKWTTISSATTLGGCTNIKSVSAVDGTGDIYLTTGALSGINSTTTNAKPDSYVARLAIDVDGKLAVISAWKSVIKVDGNYNDDFYKLNILSSDTIMADGPSSDAYKIDDYGNISFTNLYQYNFNKRLVKDGEETSDYDVTYNRDGSIDITSKPSSGKSQVKIEVEFSVTDDKFVVPVNVVSAASTGDTVRCYFEKEVSQDTWESCDALDLSTGVIINESYYEPMNTSLVFTDPGKHFYTFDFDDGDNEEESVKLKMCIIMEGAKSAYDVDKDGKITVADALEILRKAAKLSEITEDDLNKYDVDGDGQITVADALAVLRVAARLVSGSYTGGISVKIENLYRYDYPRLPLSIDTMRKRLEDNDKDTLQMSKNTFDTLVRDVIRLNKGIYSFDFLYQVNPDEEIENPIQSNNFFNKNHIYNNFTIGKMRKLDSDSIKIIQVLR